MALVRVLAVNGVAPPTPGPAMPLSFFDTYWIALPPIQRIFLYPETTNLSFSSAVSSLKSSLSETLLKFHPFAGKLSYLPSSADVIIDCSRVDEGVKFVEAESDVDIGRLAADPTHHSKAFIDLVPELEMEALPMAVMAVQVTRFGGGGLAVGMTIHHSVADGKGVWQFIDAWAATCRGEKDERSVPLHERAVIGHARGEEIARRFLKDLAPDLPKVSTTIFYFPFLFPSNLTRCNAILKIPNIKFYSLYDMFFQHNLV